MTDLVGLPRRLSDADHVPAVLKEHELHSSAHLRLHDRRLHAAYAHQRFLDNHHSINRTLLLLESRRQCSEEITHKHVCTHQLHRAVGIATERVVSCVCGERVHFAAVVPATDEGKTGRCRVDTDDVEIR